MRNKTLISDISSKYLTNNLQYNDNKSDIGGNN
jgi:hypothetical protein